MLEAVLDRVSPRGPYPGPRPWPIVGQTLDFARHGIMGVLEESWRRYGDFFRLTAGDRAMFVTMRPEDIETILIREREKFVKDTVYEQVRLLFGNGLVTSEGEVWRRQRRIAQPPMVKARVAELAAPMASATARMVDDWGGRLALGQDFDVYAELLKLTMWIIGDTLFGLDLAGSIDRSAESFTVALEELSGRGNELVKLPLWLPTPGNRRLRRALTTLDDVVYGIIDSRRRSGDIGDDLLGAFLAATDEQGRPLPTEEIRDQVITFFLAGHETTAIALSWTFYLLGEYPSIAAAIEAEVDEVLGGRTPTAEDVDRLDLTRRAFMEALRLYPPAWSGGRDIVAPVQLSGYEVGPPATVMYVPYLTHRHPEFWPDPLRFDPERFQPAAIKERHRCAYLPFSLGPRMCIGNHFSLLEGPLILAMICQRFRLRRTPGQRIGKSFQITLRPDPGLLVRVAEVR